MQPQRMLPCAPPQKIKFLILERIPLDFRVNNVRLSLRVEIADRQYQGASDFTPLFFSLTC